MSIVHDDVTIPLLLSGTTIFMEKRTPTQSELDNCPHIHRTCDADWNPQTVRLSAAQSVEAEKAIAVEPGLAQISSVYCSKEVAEAINDQRFIKSTQVDVPGSRTFVSSKRNSQLTCGNLIENWNIGLQQAKQTLQVTTQKGVCSAIVPLSRRYRTDLMHQQKKLQNHVLHRHSVREVQIFD